MDETLRGLHFDAGAVNFNFTEGYTYTSGMRAPIYIDNRKLLYLPSTRERVIASLRGFIEREKFDFDVLAGVATGGIAPAALLAAAFDVQFVYVRAKSKEHGLKRRIEGGEVKGKNVLVIEDMITTGGSSVDAVQALQAEGAIIKNCLSITSFNFQSSWGAFKNVGVSLHPLMFVSDIIEEAHRRDILSSEEEKKALGWLKDPYTSW